MIDVRTLTEPDFRPAHSLFRAALHAGPAPDEKWVHVRDSYEPGRALGAFDGDELVGTAQSFAMRMAVPGGGVLPMAGVTRVGVQADHTRRGALTALMRAQLRDLHSRGEPFASLRATEYGIYRRYGYGVASRGRDVEVDLYRAAPRPDAPTGGEVRLVDRSRIRDVLPAVYERLGMHRPGTATRPAHWWDNMINLPLATGEHLMAAVHRGEDGDDGFVVWTPHRDPRSDGRLEVRDMVTGGAQAHAGLWRFLTGIDLMRHVEVRLQPLDDPLELLVDDPRAVRTTGVEDEVWLRLVDVPAALAARRYGHSDEPVVIEVADAVLGSNAGCYRIGPDGAERSGDRAALVLDVATLANAYLGDRAPSALAAAGRIEVRDAGALPILDGLLATPSAPWCGTYF